MSRHKMKNPWNYISNEFEENSYNKGLGIKIDDFMNHLALLHSISVHNEKLRKEVEDLIILFCKGELR